MQSSESSLSADASLDAGGGCAADWETGTGWLVVHGIPLSDSDAA